MYSDQHIFRERSRTSTIIAAKAYGTTRSDVSTVALRPVLDDATVVDQEHALDLGNDVGQVMRDQHDARTGLCQLAQRRAKLVVASESRGWCSARPG